MRKVWLLASTLLAFLNFVKSQDVARSLYSTRYDNLDIDTILGSNRLVSNYVDCLLSRKPCPPEGKDLKRILPEALRTKCTRCSPIQKENALKIITRLYYDYPDQYRALRERWDPSGEYHRRFEEYLRGLQFNQIGGNGGSTTSVGSPSVSNTVESGGNDRPVRNDLDRQPATQSSNVQAVVIDPQTLAGQPSDPAVPVPTPAAVVPATERPRPPAPVAQILFPTTTTPSDTSSPSTTTSTSTSTFGSLELTTLGPLAANIAGSASITEPPGELSLDSARPDRADSTGPVVPVPVNYYLNITNGGSLTLWMVHDPQLAGIGIPRPDEAQPPIWEGSQLAQQIPPAQRPPGVNGFVEFGPFATFDSIAPIVQQPSSGDSVGIQNWGPAGNSPQLALASTIDVSGTTAGLVVTTTRPTIVDGFDALLTAPPLVVVNRFGEDGNASRPPVPVVPVETATTTTTPRPTTTVRQTRPVTRQTTTRNNQRTTTRFATNVPLQPSPIVGLWNQLGTKIADTADAIAGMLKKTVDVLVTSHIQSHQRALRRI
ncbi:uncharacterized protein LOC128723788 [Anopheles nili]|uniref:uncharacterized protein LOC128723788 n=1 Tax=Anopheles nili TaxID=185578 RepID=UPI00237A3624|nr:uncharacterized protein LOC128723788 [Anopheles nili]